CFTFEPVLPFDVSCVVSGLAAVARATGDARYAAAVARARLYVDARSSALAESGDVLLPIREGAIGEAHVVAEIGSVLAGSAPGRGSGEEITIFKSLGLAVEDLAAARFAFDEAVARGLGESIAFP
ncbi:MAG: hypothetical protein ACREIU_11085, partial [Planctomycetota bacterium]